MKVSERNVLEGEVVGVKGRTTARVRDRYRQWQGDHDLDHQQRWRRARIEFRAGRGLAVTEVPDVMVAPYEHA